MPPHTYHVYVMASRSRTLYIGVTGDLAARVSQHKAGEAPGFTARYRVDRLVYAEGFGRVEDAIAWEKRLKGWTRARKVALVEERNPTWDDLSERW